MNENRGLFGFRRLTDRGPFVKKEVDPPFKELRDLGYKPDFYWLDQIHPEKLNIRLKEVSKGSYDDTYIYEVGSFKTINPNKDQYNSDMSELERIEPNSSKEFLYRGLNWYEMQFIIDHGYIKSDTSHNIGEIQEGVTFYTTDIGTGIIYASSFSPWYHEPTIEKPSYVIKIRRGDKEVKIAKNGERGIEGDISASEIIGVYEIGVLKEKPTELELRIDRYANTLSEGSRFGGRKDYGWRKIEMNGFGSW